MQPILVTGATGTVGRHVVAELEAAGVPLRSAVRTPPAEPDASRVVFDFTDPSTWPTAFVDVETMFVVRPPELTRVRSGLLPALAAARGQGLRHVVFLSLQGAERNRVVPHTAVEAWLRQSGLAWTFVRPSFFVQNLITIHGADIRDRDILAVPAGSSRTSFVDARDVAAVSAASLLDPAAHAGRAWTVTGPRAMTYGEVAALLSAELGRPIRYTDPNLVSYLRHAWKTLGLPAPLAAISAAIYTTARLGLAAGVTDDVATVLGRPPLPLATSLHLEREAWLRPTPVTPPVTTGRTCRVKIAVLGASGRTGRPLVEELLRRGHQVRALVRDPAKLAAREGLEVVSGTSRDHHALRDLVTGTDAVVSALGPTGQDTTLHRETAQALAAVMTEVGVSRFVGISGAGIDVPGDRKSRRDRIISTLVQTLGGHLVQDKPAEYRVWAASERDWTLVRPPRLKDGTATGRVEHHAHASPRTTLLQRADLAVFLADVVEQHLYSRQAPLIAQARP